MASPDKTCSSEPGRNPGQASSIGPAPRLHGDARLPPLMPISSRRCTEASSVAHRNGRGSQELQGGDQTPRDVTRSQASTVDIPAFKGRMLYATRNHRGADINPRVQREAKQLGGYFAGNLAPRESLVPGFPVVRLEARSILLHPYRSLRVPSRQSETFSCPRVCFLGICIHSTLNFQYQAEKQRNGKRLK